MGLEQLEGLIQNLESSDDPQLRDKILEILGPILDLHRDAFARVLAILQQHGDQKLITLVLKDPLLQDVFAGYGVNEQPETVAQPAKQKLVSVEELLSRTAAATHDKWLPLLHEFELREGEFLKVQLFDDEIMVCSVRGGVYAFKNHCPEAGGGFEKSTLQDFLITCPCHSLRFDLRTGRCESKHILKLDILPISVEEGIIRMAL